MQLVIYAKTGGSPPCQFYLNMNVFTKIIWKISRFFRFKYTCHKHYRVGTSIDQTTCASYLNSHKVSATSTMLRVSGCVTHSVHDPSYTGILVFPRRRRPWKCQSGYWSPHSWSLQLKKIYQALGANFNFISFRRYTKTTNKIYKHIVIQFATFTENHLAASYEIIIVDIFSVFIYSWHIHILILVEQVGM